MNYIDQIKMYKPYNEQEEKDKELILHCIETQSNILSRENKVAHITSSGFIVNKTRDKVLMIHHNIYNSWGWTGGHADGEEDLLKVALKEAKEETGVKSIKPITNNICSIEVLTVNSHIKNNQYISAHLHMSVAYILEAVESEQLYIKPDENSGVKWIDIDKVNNYVNEEHMKYVYKKLIQKSKLI
ncbi:MAG: NUDIX hydrolase [Paraclostridium sp.]